MSNLNVHQLAQTANLTELDRYLATPAIWTPGMSEEDWQEESRRMFNRSIAAHAFVSGQLGADEFEDALFYNGYDPDTCFELWEEGQTLI